MENISILGSTGSIGRQTLDIVRDHRDRLRVIALTANRNIERLQQQIEEFSPEFVCVTDERKAKELKRQIGSKVEIYPGVDGLVEAAAHPKANRVVTAVSGMIGLVPTLKAIEAGKIIALANKETLVAGGELVMKALEKHSGRMYPVDSEHSAIFQGLMGNENNPIYKIVLTASGGPFRDATKEMLENATLEQALKHPNWSMGKKVTIDSATLMNKGLEVIEAKWLFDLQPDQIEVVVHPQSIVHSLVEFEDHSSMAQMGYPDMKVPIQLALFYPKRVQNQLKSLRLDQVKELTFYGPDTDLFPCLALAYDALETSGTMPAVLNAANEIAVEQFLNREIRFVDIPKKLERVMNRHRPISNPSLQDVLDVDQWARKAVREKS